ncbi:MAG: DUF4330 domain-containing protein [Bacillota bacterium]|nr:DUF4330 domain-containing protein [Bacillota bacterium]
MIIDKQGKLFGKISVVDIFIIAVIIAAIVMLGVKLGGLENFRTAQGEKTYVVKVEGVKQIVADAIKKGDSLGDGKGVSLGVVQGKEVKTARVIKQKENGQYISVENPNRVDVYLTIKGKGKENNGTFYLGGSVSLLVGTVRYFVDSAVNFQGSIMQIIG